LNASAAEQGRAGQGRAGGIDKQLATSIPHDDAPPLVSSKICLFSSQDTREARIN
jgi:hypothetical protein